MFALRAIARPAAKILAAIGALSAVLLAMTVSAAPAGAANSAPTYTLHTILDGMSLHHWYTPAGSDVRRSEPLTQPDDITRLGLFLFIGFQNGVGPQGQASPDGNRDSTIVELSHDGAVVGQWDIQGKCDGLTANPVTSALPVPGLVIATVNEDANSSLYTINSGSGQIVHYSYNRPLAHFGGTDAISFFNPTGAAPSYNTVMLISASAPGTTGAAAPNAAYPAVYMVSLDKATSVAYVQPLFFGESQATAANGPHAGQQVQLGLTDPDSNEVVPQTAPRFAGDFMLTSQGDKEQIYVSDPGTADQHMWVLGLSQSVDDTAWVTGYPGELIATDHDADTVDALSGSYTFGTAFVAVTPCDANGAPATCPGPGFPSNYLGTLNMFTGQITPVHVVGGSLEPGGMLFAPSWVK